jgi:ubiquinone biosynthesis protein
MSGVLTLAQKVAVSSWGSEEPGLADAVAAWEREIEEQRSRVEEHAARLARPGALPVVRTAWQYGAFRLSRAGWAVRHLPRDIAERRMFREPAAWAKESVAHVLRDQLVLLGPAGAEVARVIDQSEGLAPGFLVDEIRRRPIAVPPVEGRVVRRIVERAFDGAVQSVEDIAMTHTPMSQLHHGVLAGGRRVAVRVRRPGVDLAMHADARITATLAGGLERLVPALRESHPLGFVELATRQMLEEVDLRNEALNMVALAMAVEKLGITGIEVPRPIPGLARPRAVVLEGLAGRPFATAAHQLDPEKAALALVGITVEAALVEGVFHADLRPEHLAVLDDGRLSVWGCGTLGCFTPDMRRGALKYLMAVLSGDFEGQVEAMRLSGAVPEGVDVARLVADLQSTPALQPMAMLAGGQESAMAGLRQAVVILLRHQLRPPIDVVLFVRSMFGLRTLLAKISPDADLLTALMPVIQRLPQLAEELEVVPSA